MDEQVVAKVRLDSPASAVQQLAHSVAPDSAEDRGAEEQRNGHLDLVEVGTLAQGVDALLDEARSDGREYVRHDDEHHPGQIGPPVWLEVGQEGTELFHRSRLKFTALRNPGKSHIEEVLMSKTMLAVLAALALAGCGRGEKPAVASADSLNRDLQLAPVDTTAALNDAPAATPPAAAAPAPAPEPAPAAPAPAPKPKPKPKPQPAPAAPATETPTPAATPAPAPAAGGRIRAVRALRESARSAAATRSRFALALSQLEAPEGCGSGIATAPSSS